MWPFIPSCYHLLTLKVTAPHFPRNRRTVPYVAALVQRVVQRHPEQVDAVKERADEEVHLLVLHERVVIVLLRQCAHLFRKVLVGRAGRLKERDAQQRLVRFARLKVVLVAQLPVVVAPVGALEDFHIEKGELAACHTERQGGKHKLAHQRTSHGQYYHWKGEGEQRATRGN